MPIPGFLQSTQVSMGALAPVGTPGGPPGRGMGPPAGGGPQSGMIVFVVENQLQTNWCWTAVTTSVSRFFSTASTWTQCRVAETTLSIAGCCQNPPANGCDVPYYLDLALQTTGNFVKWSMPPTKNDIVGEITGNHRPLCLRVAWAGGGGHFIAISGFAWGPANDFIDVEDPAYGPSTVTTASLTNGTYQLGNGTWTHSFFTKP
jgi:hypothetical protein